ncbi:MAG: type II secretion system GspH family protein [bacterium]|nr:type II secretion system GspH family protein [bacterium]
MKKFGFTLAEVLITLTIIGVVAAITLPSLVTNTGNAQIGPKLAKIVSSFELANEMMLTEESSVSIVGLAHNGQNLNTQQYVNRLRTYMRCTTRSASPDSNLSSHSFGDGYIVTTKDGISVYIPIQYVALEGVNDIVDSNRRRLSMIAVDINGFETEPNLDSKDRFYFVLYDDGTLRPKGSILWNNATSSDATTDTEHWSHRTKCPNDAVPTDPTYCAGSVFENNYKVLYR